MITFERVFSGRITSIRQTLCDTLGNRGYEVMFSGKQLYFECHKKRALPISVGDRIRFTGTWETFGNKKYFQIREVLDDQKMEMLESQKFADILSHQEKEEVYA